MKITSMAKLFILLSLFLVLPLPETIPAAETGSVLDARSFIKNFVEAYKANDEAKMEELVRQAEPIVFHGVELLTTMGIKSRAKGEEEAARYFEIAEAIALVYASEFDRERLLDLVRKYISYSQEMCREKLKGNEFINEGISLNNKSQWKDAVYKWTEALKIFQRLGDVAGEAKALMNIGTVYTNLGQYTEALNYHNQALEIKRKIGDVAGEASDLTNIGIVYKSLGQYTEALNYHKQALEIDRKIGYVAEEAKALGNIGIVYRNLGQYTEALDYYKQALEIMIQIGDVAGAAKTLGNIGAVYRVLGQYTEALNHYKQALEIMIQIGAVAGAAKVLTNIGNVYDSLGQYTEALNHYKQALEIMIQIGDVAGEAKTLGNIGIIYYDLAQYTEALDYYKQALEITIQIGDVAGEAAALTNIGNVYYQLGQYQEAVETLRQSTIISEKIGALETVWRCCLGLGESIWKSGNPEEAVTQYQKSIDTIEKLYSETTGLKQEERSSMIGEKAFVYQEFIELLLELHKKSPGKGYDKQAFVVSEKAKSRVFQELMAKAGAKIAFAEEAKDETFKKMVERENQLIAEAANYRTLLTKELSKPEKGRNQEVVTSLKEQLAKAEKSLTDHQKTIDEKYPRYADLKRPKPLTVEDLQDTLKPGETVVSYAVAQDKTAVFIIGKKNFTLIELPAGAKDLTERVRKFRNGLDNVSTLKDLEGFKPEIAYELYQKIFQPVATELKEVKKLYISADSVLYTLPFEALVDGYDQKTFRDARKAGGRGEIPKLGEYNTLHYVVDSYTITYLPSATVFRSLRKYEKPGYGKWDKSLIAFADPIFSPEEAKAAESKDKKDSKMEQRGITKETELAMQIVTRSTGGTELKRLKASAEEATAIVSEVKGRKEDTYMREKATEDNVYKADLKDARYILFSTHGLLGGDFSGVAEPSLALTLINNPPGRDGFLTMSKVLGLDLNSELVILSACNTSGKGDKAGSGEGFAGLTRSFMYAGTKSILVTHWSVESQAARDLMVGTIRDMKKEAKPEALREAKLEMKSGTRKMGKENLSLSHPFYWAPFVMVGEGE